MRTTVEDQISYLKDSIVNALARIETLKALPPDVYPAGAVIRTHVVDIYYPNRDKVQAVALKRSDGNWGIIAQSATEVHSWMQLMEACGNEFEVLAAE